MTGFLTVTPFHSSWQCVPSARPCCCSIHLASASLVHNIRLDFLNTPTVACVAVFERHCKIFTACHDRDCLAGVVFVPAKTPVKLEATDDGLDVWIAAVNPQAFQGEFSHPRIPSENVNCPERRFPGQNKAVIAGGLLSPCRILCRKADDGCQGMELLRTKRLDWRWALFWLYGGLGVPCFGSCR